MWHHDVILTRPDARRLRGLIRPRGKPPRRPDHAPELAHRLRDAHVVEPSGAPADLVTMHSTVRIRHLRSGRDEIYTLVYPKESNPSVGLLSVLSPLGAALLGSRAGERLRVPGSTGERVVRIQEVMYQPTAAE